MVESALENVEGKAGPLAVEGVVHVVGTGLVNKLFPFLERAGEGVPDFDLRDLVLHGFHIHAVVNLKDFF